MTNEKTPTLEELEAALRHYSSYDAAIRSIKDQREEHLWDIKSALTNYLIDEQILKDMVFRVSEEYKSEVKLLHESPKIPLVEMLEEHFQFKSWHLMGFKRENEYAHASIEINKWSIRIMLPEDVTKEEIKQLKEKFGFTIDTCSFVESICQSRDRIKYFEDKLNLYG